MRESVTKVLMFVNGYSELYKHSVDDSTIQLVSQIRQCYVVRAACLPFSRDSRRFLS